MADNGWNLNCPAPLGQEGAIQIGHGGGGKLTQRLIEKIFIPAFGNPQLEARHDGAVLEVPAGRLAFTTDSYVVSPLFFPGGDIGSLSVNGTVNDLAMCGAKPLALSLGLILEEGLPIATLERIAASIRRAADAANVTVVTGDTKVVEKGKGDGIYINTAGVGIVPAGLRIDPGCVRAGDAVILSGDIGRHGVCIMAQREGLAFETSIESDCAPLADAVGSVLASQAEVHCLRDLTRGGLASALIEISAAAKAAIEVDETLIPVEEEVRSACELLGLDPFYVANEGRFIAFVDAKDADRALAALRRHPLGKNAACIGRVLRLGQPVVTARQELGSGRILDLFSGEQLPRIC